MQGEDHTEAHDVWLDDGVIMVRLHTEQAALEEQAAGMRAMEQLARAGGGRARMIVDLGRQRIMPRGIRKAGVEAIDWSLFERIAFVFHNPVQRAIAAMLIELNKPTAMTMDVKMAGNVEEASAWIRR